MSAAAARLIVVSNRLPVVLDKATSGQWRVTPAVGGLVTALLPVLETHGGTWVGWPGTADADQETIAARLDAFTKGFGYDFSPVMLSRKDVDDFYRGFSNEIVWPLFHDLFTSCVFEPRYWQAYQSVNQRFAGRVADSLGESDVVWVHDYHLMHLAADLRALGHDNRIGFFLHVPFPGPDIFFKLPWRDAIMAGLLAFNQIGFQTERDERNFLECVRRLVGPVEEVLDVYGTCLRSPAARLPTPHRERALDEVVVGSFPISIDFQDFAGRADNDSVTGLSEHLTREFRARKLYLGVDRLDYSKGLPQKLAAYRLALERHPDMHTYVTLVQHVVPSREDVPDYRRQRLEIERLVGEINGTFGEPGWMPVHYYYHTLSPGELLAYYRASHAAMVTPLKDGMNLVAKEFCACRLDDDGVLILSEFAGAAAEMGQAALLINPFDVEGVAASIRQAYEMPLGEQRSRMKTLRRIVRENDVHRWADRCLAASSQGQCRPRAVLDRSDAVALDSNPSAAPDARRSRAT